MAKKKEPIRRRKNYAAITKDIPLGKEEKAVPIPRKAGHGWKKTHPLLWASVSEMSISASKTFPLESEFAVKKIAALLTMHENKRFVVRKVTETLGRIWRMEDVKTRAPWGSKNGKRKDHKI